MKLPGCMKDTRLRTFGENYPFWMPLQLLDKRTDETHGKQISQTQTNRNLSDDQPNNRTNHYLPRILQAG